jgi:RNA polymerase sigma-70 factor (ECF subfamily)
MHPILTDPLTTTLIDRKVASLHRTWGLSQTDADDVRQEIYLDLLERLPKHNPTKAPIALFVSACIHRKIYNLVRGMLAQRRSPVRDSVDRMDEAMTTTGTPVDTSAAEHAGDRERVLRDLRLDLAAATRDLTDEERDLLQDLMSESVSDIARRTGRTRKMVYRVFRSLRQKLADGGLGHDVAA